MSGLSVESIILIHVLPQLHFPCSQWGGLGHPCRVIPASFFLVHITNSPPWAAQNCWEESLTHILGMFSPPFIFLHRLSLRPRRAMCQELAVFLCSESKPSLSPTSSIILIHLRVRTSASVGIIFAFYLVTIFPCEQEILWPVFSKTYSRFQLLFLLYLDKACVLSAALNTLSSPWGYVMLLLLLCSVGTPTLLWNVWCHLGALGCGPWAWGTLMWLLM